MVECQATLAYPFSTHLNLFSRIELARHRAKTASHTYTLQQAGVRPTRTASLNHDNFFPKATNFMSWQSGVVITQIPVEMTHPMR
jgi:hypothetical protein